MSYISKSKAFILLSDGTIFYGKSAGFKGVTFGELCFNTGMSGYQEIFTDPSYYGQLMVMSNAHIGNYGVVESENESPEVKIAGLICKNFSSNFSRSSATQSLGDFLEDQKLVVISDVDTRALVSYIRDHGAQNAAICCDESTVDEIKGKLVGIPSMDGLELASKVSTKEPYFYGSPDAKYRISVLDLGIKENILRNFAQRDCYIKVFPFNSSLESLESFDPHGYFLSNGPGDPEPLVQVQEVARQILKRNLPLFGICLGHQIIALANDIPTYKMFNGHRGINHPVKNLETGKGEITSQNHGFAIDKEKLLAHPDFILTHVHLNDETVAGMKMKSKKCFSVQYHPEASPGPHDSSYLFDLFIDLLRD